MEIYNRVTFKGKTYVQYVGKDKSQWWLESENRPKDGNSYDTDELTDVKKSLDRDDKEWAATVKAHDEERGENVAYIDVLTYLVPVSEPSPSKPWTQRG